MVRSGVAGGVRHRTLRRGEAGFGKARHGRQGDASRGQLGQGQAGRSSRGALRRVWSRSVTARPIGRLEKSGLPLSSRHPPDSFDDQHGRYPDHYPNFSHQHHKPTISHRRYIGDFPMDIKSAVTGPVSPAPDAAPRIVRGVCCTQLLQSADEVMIRPLGQNAFELVVGLRATLSLETLKLLAARTDRHLLIEQALSLPSPAGEPPAAA